MAQTAPPEDESAELSRRARELTDAIAARRVRIRQLQGLASHTDRPRFSLRRYSEIEVEEELPALDPERAHEALVDAIHRETGLIGAVKTRGDDLEWKVFDPRTAGRTLEVRLEGGRDAPRLRIRDNASTASGNTFVAAGLMVVMIPLLLVAAMARFNPLLMMVIAIAIAVASIVGSQLLVRRSGYVALAKLAASIADALPMRRSEARVEVEDEADDEAEERALAEAALEAEASRGLP